LRMMRGRHVSLRVYLRRWHTGSESASANNFPLLSAIVSTRQMTTSNWQRWGGAGVGGANQKNKNVEMSPYHETELAAGPT
jgi:hypothetical protein